MSKAKKHQLFVYEAVFTVAYASARQPAKHESFFYFGKALSVNREGYVTRYTSDDVTSHKGRPSRLWLLPERFGQKVWAAWIARPFPRDFKSLEEAKAFVKSFDDGGPA